MNLESADPSPSSMEPKNKSEKRKRKKFIRKVACQICGDVANDHIHYGATTCYSCRAFFRRSITAQVRNTRKEIRKNSFFSFFFLTKKILISRLSTNVPNLRIVRSLHKLENSVRLVEWSSVKMLV